MVLEAFDIYTYRLPLNRPLVFRGRSFSEREGLLIRLRSGPCIGWGEIAPLPGFSSEDLEAAMSAAKRLRFALRGHTAPDHLEELSGEFDRWLAGYRLPASVRCGFEAAVLHLMSARRDMSIAQLLSDRPLPRVRVNGLITEGTNTLADELTRVLNAHYRTVKVKVGRESIETDIHTVRTIASQLEAETSLRLDANRAWEFDKACRFAEGIADVAIEYIEEPLADSRRLAELARRTKLPLALDESIQELPPEKLTSFEGLTAVILRPTVIGGYETTMRYARRAISLGLTPVLSSAVESAVGIAGLLNLASALTPKDVAIGLDTLTWFDRQPASTQLRITDGWLTVESAMSTLATVDYMILHEVGND